jgi:hypothetical protein
MGITDIKRGKVQKPDPNAKDDDDDDDDKN